MTILYRAGNLNPHKKHYFFVATRTAAEIWAKDLHRPLTSIIEVEVDDDVPCIVNTHGYVECDWNYGNSNHPKMKIFRVNWNIREVKILLEMFEGDLDYDYHEIVIHQDLLK